MGNVMTTNQQPQSEDFEDRLVALEEKIDGINGRFDTLTATIEEAMILFSHSESSVHAEQTERRFRSHLKDTQGIQSRYRGTVYATD